MTIQRSAGPVGPGEIVELTATEAAFLRAAGKIEPAAPAPAQAPKTTKKKPTTTDAQSQSTHEEVR